MKPMENLLLEQVTQPTQPSNDPIGFGEVQGLTEAVPVKKSPRKLRFIMLNAKAMSDMDETHT